MPVLPGHGDRRADVLLAQLAGVATADRHPPLLGVEKPQQEVRHGRLPGPALADEGDSAARLEPQRRSLQYRRVVRPVARADVLQADGDRGHRQRSGPVGIGDPRPAVDQFQHALAGGDRRAQVANRAGEAGLDGVEEASASNASIATSTRSSRGLRVRLDGDPEDAGHGGADGAELKAVAEAAGERVASADAYKQAVGCAQAREPVALPPVDDQLRCRLQQLDQLGRQPAAGDGLPLGRPPRQPAGNHGHRDAGHEETAREHERRSGQERRGDAHAHGPRDGCDEQRVEAAQVEVLERVDVGDQAGEQVAAPVPLELGRRQRSIRS